VKAPASEDDPEILEGLSGAPWDDHRVSAAALASAAAGSPAPATCMHLPHRSLAPPTGDEVDPNLIVAGGRRGRHGRAGASAPAAKYSAEAQVASDEDEW
jgi:hypothetical protein